jgi:hypothetical protein
MLLERFRSYLVGPEMPGFGFVSSMSLSQVPGSTDLENNNDIDSKSYEAGSVQLNLALPWPSQVLRLQSSKSSSQPYISHLGHSKM